MGTDQTIEFLEDSWTNTDKEIEREDAKALEYAEELKKSETSGFGMGVDDDGY
jgi:hypothetical protein